MYAPDKAFKINWALAPGAPSLNPLESGASSLQRQVLRRDPYSKSSRTPPQP
jgi:hypothetical protein